MKGQASTGHVPLAWTRDDIEQRLFFPGGWHTRVNMGLTFLLALLTTIAFYAALIPYDTSVFAKTFTVSKVQYATVLLSAWSLIILLFKWSKLLYQRRALGFRVVPTEADFVLSAANVDHVVDRVYEIVDDPKYFILYKRIVIALANLKNLGRIGDVDEILRSQAENDDGAVETSYAVLSGFVWAIPVLGFIGTVIGLSYSIGEFGNVLKGAKDMEEITGSLRNVTAGLTQSFETTLVALIAALVIQLLITFLKKSEQEFLDDCSQYCTANVVNRLRIMPFELAE